jgi:superfamily II DNA or RNA helicase
MLHTGLYEQVINKKLNDDLATAADKLQETAPLDGAEASCILAKYAAEIIEKGLDNLKDSGGNLNDQVALTNKIVSLIQSETKEGAFESLTVDQRAEQLLALLDKKNSTYSLKGKVEVVRPETSISRSSLFTGAIHEPSMFSELKKEILSSDRIDMLVSFVKWSGLRLIIDELQQFTENGGKLRIITTSYMGATDVKAVEELRQLPGAEIKISYDTKRTRLHAKTYVFHRDTGFTTAYVGSSNLSNAAISSGLEWNVKITAKDLPDTIQKINATYESYWNSSDFENYTVGQQKRLESALKAEKYFESNDSQPYLFDIAPYPYQQEILDKLEAERIVRQQFRNLIVAATGTGKTVIAAFDYKRFRRENHGKPCRLLFIAHREEILKQSVNCFRGVLKDANFGELFVGRYQPESIDHLFMSIQTFNSQDWQEKTTSDFYNYIIIDEFHHAAAPTYQKLLSYYRPKILLGLTATPERMDGQNVIEYFNNRIAAEIRLPEAIDRKLLCPFQYFGVTDTMDLNELKWSRGGYDRAELSNLYTLNSIAASTRCNMIISSLFKYVTDINDVRALGFCVSVAHAEFMAEYFNKKGISSIALTGQSPDEERDLAKAKLTSSEVRFIFVVDIYNEGVDIPEVNTIMFLRPTESLTIFLQQLGRGLRLSENKDCLTVLDFIGQANRKYNFEDKFSALLTATTKSIQREIKDGFTAVPKGCYIQLERKAKEYILDNIRASFGVRTGIIARIATFEEDTGKPLSLENFVEYYHLDVRNIYVRGSFARLCAAAAVRDDFDEPLEDLLTKAFPRICAIDSRRWILFLLSLLNNLDTTDFTALSSEEAAMVRMLYSTIWQDPAEDLTANAVLDNLHALSSSAVMLDELKALLRYNYDHIDFIDEPVDLGFDCPLDLHCSYTRDQILLALEFMKPNTVREGVKWLPEKQCDVFFVTLNKSDKEYSPTTMYNDYSINELLFHWQSQSTTSEDSPTGQRYIHHRERGSSILLFVREYRTDIAGAAPYTFLGLADYMRHEGSRPMSITWKLKRPIPAKYLKKTNKLVVG